MINLVGTLTTETWQNFQKKIDSNILHFLENLHDSTLCAVWFYI